MEWNDKIELCTLLNNENYVEAVEFIRNKDIDPQAMDMFITGCKYKKKLYRHRTERRIL